MRPPIQLTMEREGVKLACLDFGGDGPPALLLHGLAGHAAEWEQTAGWLTRSHRVVAFDQRGHGSSERNPDDVSPEARVADVAFVIDQLDIAPALLVGQSLGGRLAILVAASHPALVRALVVVEASPAGAGAQHAAKLAADVSASLARWPAPFDSREAAVEFFGGPSVSAQAWAGGLELRDDGRWWPAFELDVMSRMLQEAAVDDRWEAWERIRCPTLVVRGAAGTLELADAEAMVRRLPGTRLVEIADAGHDAHLERPAAWQEAVRDFLAAHMGSRA